MPVALLRAFAEMESGGKSGFCSMGLPVITFEGHGFGRGYKTVDDFVAARKAEEAGQLLAFVGFFKANPACLEAMRKKEFKGTAIGYNGSDYGDYDKRIEKAYKKYGGT